MKRIHISRRMAIILIVGQIAIDISFAAYLWITQIWYDKVTAILGDMLLNGMV